MSEPTEGEGPEPSPHMELLRAERQLEALKEVVKEALASIGVFPAERERHYVELDVKMDWPERARRALKGE